MIECGVSYFGVRRVKHARRDLEEMARQGMSYVVHTFGENDLKVYYETMRGIVQASHDMGLDVWLDPWCIGNVFAAEDYPSDFALWHPEAAQIDQYGKMLPGACPNQPLFREYLRQWTEAAVDLGPQAIFWDEPHWYIGTWYSQPDRWGCRCEVCQSLYKEIYGEDMPTDGNVESVQSFRADSLLRLLDEALRYAKSLGVKNVVTLLPTEYHQPGAIDWEAVADLSAIDNLGTDPYPFPAYDNSPSFADHWRDYVRRYARKIAGICEERHLGNHLWIQGFSLPADDLGYLDEVMDLAVAEGITNLAVWGFDGHRDMSKFVCEEPDKVWETIGRGFRRIRGI